MARSPKSRNKDAAVKTISVALNDADYESAPVYYSNHIEMSAGLHEYEISFGKIPTRLTAEQAQEAANAGKLIADTIVRVVIPPTLIDNFIRVLHLQKEKRELMVQAAEAKNAEPEEDRGLLQ